MDTKETPRMVNRILFVDDEPKVLTGLRRMLHGFRRDWEMQFCDNPRTALTLIAEGDFDVIVTDMRMPHMDGAEFLTRVRDVRPETVRIVLSGQSDHEKIMRAVGPAHQYLAKPCDPERLQQTIQRALEIRGRLRDPQLRRLVAGLSSLPTLPTIYVELVAELRREDASIEHLGELISGDMALTAKILQLVNSSFFGLPVIVHSPSHAAALLGVETLRPLVLSAGVFRQLEESAAPASLVEHVQEHSLAVGCVARRICECERVDEHSTATALLAGVLHDVGKLILADHFGARYTRLLAKAEGSELCGFETQEFGGSHAAVGGFLAGLWGLSHDVVEAIAFHHDPCQLETGTVTPLAAVHAANALVHAGLETSPVTSRATPACEKLHWRDALAATALASP